MGLETATDGAVVLDNNSIGSIPIENRTTETVADIQMVFQNPFDTLNPFNDRWAADRSRIRNF